MTLIVSRSCGILEFASMAKKLRITYTKSSIGYNKSQQATVRALGLKKLSQTVEHDDTAVIRGMINKVSHLVTVEEVK
jgi:large subunit ribosomal protein L30